MKYKILNLVAIFVFPSELEAKDKLNDPNICVPGGEEKLQSTETSYYKDEMH